MVKRLAFLVTLSVLVGVFVLSEPATAGGSAPKVKGQVSIVTNQPAKANTTVQPQPTTSQVIMQLLRFGIARWLGLPDIIIAPKPPVKDGLQLSDGRKEKRTGIMTEAPMRDNGGYGVDK